ncbi:urea transporter 1-like [Frankliniella occidentalis]|uniref:Urea transporter 1-like n=1 Tax=Frankliniella occidentalis TaxID=133901 RepID=A0A9C6XVX0_FRAOC|nr:urea transporter 1-like [Frankliniella occidentalis]
MRNVNVPRPGWVNDRVGGVDVPKAADAAAPALYPQGPKGIAATKDRRAALATPVALPPDLDQESVTHSEPEEESHGVLSQIMLGSSPALARALAARPLSAAWAPAHWLHSVLRATGAPCFLDNPFSGALILVAMAVDESCGPEGAGATLLGATCALAVAMALLGERSLALSSPGLTFNGALIGVTLGNGTALHDRAWLLAPIVVLSALSAWLSRGLSAVLARVEMPALNLAFNVLVALWLAVEASWAPGWRAPAGSYPANASTVDWAQVATSVLMAPGPVFACTSITSCCLLYVAFLVFSPMLFVVGLIGAAVGTLIGVALCPGAELASLYAGQWGYCPLLTACALGGVFFVCNVQSVVLSAAGAVTAALTYGALLRVLQPLGVPVLAWPFVLSTWMLVGNPRSSLSLTPVPLAEVTTPEEARRREQQLRALDQPPGVALQAVHAPRPSTRAGFWH